MAVSRLWLSHKTLSIWRCAADPPSVATALRLAALWLQPYSDRTRFGCNQDPFGDTSAAANQPIGPDTVATDEILILLGSKYRFPYKMNLFWI